MGVGGGRELVGAAEAEQALNQPQGATQREPQARENEAGLLAQAPEDPTPNEEGGRTADESAPAASMVRPSVFRGGSACISMQHVWLLGVWMREMVELESSSVEAADLRLRFFIQY